MNKRTSAAAFAAAIFCGVCPSQLAQAHGGWGGRSFGNSFNSPNNSSRQPQQQGNALKPLPLTIHDKWAVMMGVGHYEDAGIKRVKYAARNVLTLTEALCDPASGRFLPDHLLVATEEKVTQDSLAESTWQAWLTKKALPNDLIVLYFCLRFVPADDGKDILLLTQESRLANKETTATSLSSILGEVRRRTQCKNIVAFLDIVPTEESAKSSPAGFASLLTTIGKKSNVTIFAADERLMSSLDDDGAARTSLFVEYFCQALRANNGNLPLDYEASYVTQMLAKQPPARDGYNSQPVLLTSSENSDIVKMPIGISIKNPNNLANYKIGHPLSQVALGDPALAARLAELDEANSPVRRLERLKQEADEDDAAREEESKAAQNRLAAGKSNRLSPADGKTTGQSDKFNKLALAKGHEEGADAASTGQEVDFVPYMAAVKKTLQSKWAPPSVAVQKNVVAVFSIQKDGSITEPEIVESGGSVAIDRSALKALADASPLSPLPAGSPSRVQVRYKFDWKMLH